MALLKPITFQLSSPKQKSEFPMAPAAAPTLEPAPASNPSFRGTGPKLPPAQPHLSITPGIDSLSRSDPPTPPRGPPPTPKCRTHNELSKADPSTPSRSPPPTPRRGEVSLGASNSLSQRDIPTPPGGLPSPTSPRRPLGRVMEGSDIFSSLSREDPPTPPSAPPSTPTGSRRALPWGLSKRDPPTPPSAPPPSPQQRRAGICSEYSRSDPPTPPSGPPPTPGLSAPWTTQEINLLVSVCRSGVKLGWCQIAGLFHGRSVLECRNKYQDVIHGQREAIDLEHECYDNDCENCPLGWGRQVFDDNSTSISRKRLSIPTVTEDPVPELIVSNGPSPVGSPVADRRVTTKRSRGRIGDVETADEGTIYRHSYGDGSSDKHYHSHKRAKTITHLSDELNFILSRQWSSDVMDRIQEHHAMSQRVLEKYWSPSITPGFELVEVSPVLGNQL